MDLDNAHILLNDVSKNIVFDFTNITPIRIASIQKKGEDQIGAKLTFSCSLENKPYNLYPIVKERLDAAFQYLGIDAEIEFIITSLLDSYMFEVYVILSVKEDRKGDFMCYRTAAL